MDTGACTRDFKNPDVTYSRNEDDSVYVVLEEDRQGRVRERTIAQCYKDSNEEVPMLDSDDEESEDEDADEGYGGRIDHQGLKQEFAAMMAKAGITRAQAQYQLLRMSQDEAVMRALSELESFLEEHFELLKKKACNCAAAKSPGIQLFRALAYSKGGYRRNVNWYPYWVKQVNKKIRGFAKKLHRLVNAYGRAYNDFIVRLPSAFTHVKLLWKISKAFAYARVPKRLFIEGTCFLGLWLKLKNIPSKLHTDPKDIIWGSNTKLSGNGSQGPGMVFALQESPQVDPDVPGPMSAPHRERGDCHSCLWTQDTHGAVMESEVK